VDGGAHELLQQPSTGDHHLDHAPPLCVRCDPASAMHHHVAEKMSRETTVAAACACAVLGKLPYFGA
jgi:hypothetical protein